MRNDLRASERLYAALLHLYPQQFRAAYGEQMRLAFRDACRVAYRRHRAGGLLALWLPTMLDLFKSACAERVRQGDFAMSNTKLVAWAAPLTIVVGALWLVSAFGSLAFQTGLLRNEAFVVFLAFPFFLSFVPLLFALFGIRLRFQQAAGAAGRLGMTLSAAGCAGLLVFLLGHLLLRASVPDGGQRMWMNHVILGCFLSIRVGFILFGIDALRHRLLPHTNVLPLLLGLTLLLSLPMEWFGVPALLPQQWAAPFLHFAISGACWVLLGIVLMDQHRQSQLTPAN